MLGECTFQDNLRKADLVCLLERITCFGVGLTPLCTLAEGEIGDTSLSGHTLARQGRHPLIFNPVYQSLHYTYTTMYIAPGSQGDRRRHM